MGLISARERSLQLLKDGFPLDRNKNFFVYEGDHGQNVLRSFKTLHGLVKDLDRYGSEKTVTVRRPNGGHVAENNGEIEVSVRYEAIDCTSMTRLYPQEYAFLLDKFPWLDTCAVEVTS